jgi:hypothetical protein
MVSRQYNSQNSTPLMEIRPSFAKIKPPAEIIELIDSCVNFSGYPRNEIKQAFLRALSLASLDIYTDINQRCRVAIDILVNKLENRFPSKPKLSYSWRGTSAGIAELESLDKFGHGLLFDMITIEPALSTTENTDMVQILKFLKQLNGKMDTLVELISRK